MPWFRLGVLGVAAAGLMLFGWTQQHKGEGVVLPARSNLRQQAAASPAIFASIPYWDQPRAAASFRDHVALIDYLSLFWYSVQADGSIAPYRDAHVDQSIIDFAHEHDVLVFALVANLPDTRDADWDARLIGRIMGDKTLRRQHIAELVTLAKAGNFDGINIDYESLEADQRADFTVFIRELGAALHRADKLLGVAIHPKTGEYNSAEDNGSWAQDWPQLHPHVDQLYFMTYGEHYVGSEPGPIASPQWLDRIMAYALAQGVPAEKIFAGLPLYGQEWRRQGQGRFAGVAADLVWKDVTALIKQGGFTSIYDAKRHSPVVQSAVAGRQRVVWYEDTRSVQAKLAALSRRGISRVALWRLGGEDPAVWKALASFTSSVVSD